MVGQEYHEIAAEPGHEGFLVSEFASAICEGVVAIGQLSLKIGERGEQPTSRGQAEVAVGVFAVHERPRMEGDVREALCCEVSLIARYGIANESILLVEHQRG